MPHLAPNRLITELSVQCYYAVTLICDDLGWVLNSDRYRAGLQLTIIFTVQNPQIFCARIYTDIKQREAAVGEAGITDCLAILLH